MSPPELARVRLRRRLIPLAFPGLAVGLLLLSSFLPVGSGALPGGGHGTSAAPAPRLALPHAAPMRGSTAPAVALAPAPRPANQTGDPSDSFVCRSINATICVSVQGLPNNPQIVPTLGNSTASIRPNASTSIFLWVKSQYPLYAPVPPPPTGENNVTPIRINVTGTLWNGDPWMTPYDGTVWHANPSQPYFKAPIPNPGADNKTKPYWYQVVISNASTGNFPNFFPGEYVTWQIYIVTKTPTNIVHRYSPIFHYWISGAWAFSPYKGAQQFGGPNASNLDLALTQSPAIPLWNDTVKVTIATTPIDNYPDNASICEARLLVTAALPNGAPLPNYTGTFPTARVGTFCSAFVFTHIPSFYSQVVGTTVSYSVVAFDGFNPLRYPADQITTATYSYTVGGNGSFPSGNFGDDILLNASPYTALTPVSPLVSSPLFAPGTTVNITVMSSNPGTALQSAQVDYSFFLPSIGERAVGVVFLGRINSTTLFGTLPGVPVGGYLNFSVLVWDYLGDLETSGTFGYGTTPLTGTMPQNLGIFWVYVYDNHTQAWITNAQVTISSRESYVYIPTHTTFGVAYPNATNQPFVPLLLAANETYNVTVAVPGDAAVTVFLTLTNPMTLSGTILQSSSATVVAAESPTGLQSGTELFFWVNTTAPGPTYSGGSPILPALIGPAIGLGLAFLAVFIVRPWWRQIAARRKEQEKRVTL